MTDGTDQERRAAAAPRRRRPAVLMAGDRYDTAAEATPAAKLAEEVQCPKCHRPGGWRCLDTTTGTHRGTHVERLEERFNYYLVRRRT